MDRYAEKRALHQVLDSVRAGMSGALVLRGEPGVRKSALLDYAVERAGGLQIVRTVAVESEMALGFAAVWPRRGPPPDNCQRLSIVDNHRPSLRWATGPKARGALALR
jgi:hypothetical protein